ncbi:MAG: AtpZ/AtpI family protein [Rhizomicrobium sp.]|jgi:ATP synthase protein I
MSEPDSDKLRALGEELDQIRRSGEQRKVQPPPKSTEVAFRFATELFAATIVGAAIGWGLDRLFHTRLIFTIVLFLFGAAAGIRNVIRASKEFNERIAQASAKDQKEH